MDVVVGLARLLARPAAATIGADGETVEQRRGEVMRDVTSPAEDVDELVLRHLARGVVWGILSLVVAAVTLSATGIVAAVRGGVPDGVVAAQLVAMFFVFFRAGVHLVKMAIASYVPDRLWNRDRLVWRATMLWQLPDIVIAAVAAAMTAASAV